MPFSTFSVLTYTLIQGHIHCHITYGRSDGRTAAARDGLWYKSILSIFVSVFDKKFEFKWILCLFVCLLCAGMCCLYGTIGTNILKTVHGLTLEIPRQKQLVYLFVYTFPHVSYMVPMLFCYHESVSWYIVSILAALHENITHWL